MTQPTAAQSAKSLLEEYAAEVGKTSVESVSAQVAPAAGKAPVAELGGNGGNLEMIMRIPVTVKVVLGSATMPVANLTQLGRGAVIALDRRVGEPVDVVVNGRDDRARRGRRRRRGHLALRHLADRDRGSLGGRQG